MVIHEHNEKILPESFTGINQVGLSDKNLIVQHLVGNHPDYHELFSLIVIISLPNDDTVAVHSKNFQIVTVSDEFTFGNNEQFFLSHSRPS